MREGLIWSYTSFLLDSLWTANTLLSIHCCRQHLASLAMAHVIGAGPVVKTCVDCAFYQYQAVASAHSQYCFPLEVQE